MRRIARATAVLALLLGGLLAVASPAHASCGDTTAEWVDPSLGSAWSGTLDGSTPFTAVLSPEALGVRPAVSIVSGLSGTGAGTWVHDYNTRWIATALLWEYRFEVSASACSGGAVTEAAGAATDALNVIHYLVMSRTL